MEFSNLVDRFYNPLAANSMFNLPALAAMAASYQQQQQHGLQSQANNKNSTPMAMALAAAAVAQHQQQQNNTLNQNLRNPNHNPTLFQPSGFPYPTPSHLALAAMSNRFNPTLIQTTNPTTTTTTTTTTNTKPENNSLSPPSSTSSASFSSSNSSTSSKNSESHKETDDIEALGRNWLREHIRELGLIAKNATKYQTSFVSAAPRVHPVLGMAIAPRDSIPLTRRPSAALSCRFGGVAGVAQGL